MIEVSSIFFPFLYLSSKNLRRIYPLSHFGLVCSYFLRLNERLCRTDARVISISGTVSGRHESWEFDSGARDLSPEPHSLQKLVEAAAGGTGNMLDLANKVSRDDLSLSLKRL